MSHQGSRGGRSALTRFLDSIEWAGNKLPHPATLFAILALSVVVGSAILSGFGYVATHPATGAEIRAVNLLSGDGLRRIITSLVSNFAGFAPLGTVLVALLGVSVAEGSGFLGTAIRGLVLSAPRRLITPFVVFAGIMSNAAGEAGYVILIPLGATIFAALGRHPLAGLAAGFAGVSGGYSANLVLGTLDPLLAGITQEAARIIDPDYRVNPAANYYFMAVSTFLLTAVGTVVTDRIVEPRLGRYEGAGGGDTLQPLTALEKRGLIVAGMTVAVLTGLVMAGLLPDGGFLRDPEYNDILHSPFLTGIVAFIFLGFLAPGIAYGLATRSIRSDGEIAGFMSTSMATMSGYIVLVFFSAQFVAFFGWTNIGLITAIQGADFLKSVGFTGIPLLISFIFLSAMINLLMGSASAKWAVIAPVFVPMFMLLGYSPELTQAAYRVGDSTTNLITPMMTYFALIVSFVQRYRSDAGLGTLIAMMLPYSLAFLAAWSALLLGWMLAGLPVGPGAGLWLER
jgi:aminobenzoyl-glutamate transport protein